MSVDGVRLGQLIREELDRDGWGKIEPEDFTFDPEDYTAEELAEALEDPGSEASCAMGMQTVLARVAKRLKERITNE